MFPRRTRLPALIVFSLLLLGPPAPAQDKKPAPSQEPQPVGAGGPGRTQPEGNPDGPFRQNQVTRRVVIFSKPEPGFTIEARANCTEGVVRLRAVLSSSGEVTNISVIKGLPDGLTEKAVAAARQIKFQPAQKDGRTVSQYIVLEYNFNITHDEDKVERKAVILEKPDPEYAREALAKLVEGKVVLDVLLHRDGTVHVEKVVEGLPGGLNEKAAEAAKKIKFIPARDKGCAATVSRRVEYVFSLK